MNQIQLLREARKNIARTMGGLSNAQLNHIPEGFNNNLIWNAGHVIATCELLTYAMAGHKTPSAREFIDRYRKGSRPEGKASATEIETIKTQLQNGVDRLEIDLRELDWSSYKRYQTSFGVELGEIKDGLQFNTVHEGMHLGTMIALRKLV